MMKTYERGYYEQVKIFTHYQRETLEQQINEWLAYERFVVLDMVATDSGGSSFAVIVRYITRDS